MNSNLAYSVLNRIMPGSEMVLSAKDVDLNNADEGLGLIGFVWERAVKPRFEELFR